MTHKSTAALAAGLVAAFLTAGASARAADLTWAPASADAWTWDTGATHAWKDAAGQAAFSNGDNAIFDSTETRAPENRTVAVSGGGGVNPAALSFSGENDYVFEGGPIAVGTELALGGTGAVTFKNAVTAAKTTLTSGTLGFAGGFDAGFFSAAGDGTVKAVGTGRATFTFSVPEGSNSTISCAWDKDACDGISVHKRGAGAATLNVKKLFNALGGADNGRIYVDEGVLTGTGYGWGSRPGEMIYEVSNNATLGSTGAHALGDYLGGIRVFLHPGATFAPGEEQYMGQGDPGIWLMGNARVTQASFRNEGALYVRAEGPGNYMAGIKKYSGHILSLNVQEGGELYVEEFDCNLPIAKTGEGTLTVGTPSYFQADSAFTVSGGTLAAAGNFTSLSAMPVAVADGAAFTNAGPGVLWLEDTASSSAGSGAFFGVFGSKSAVQNFTNGLTVKGHFHISGDGFRADYTGLTVDGRAVLEYGIRPPLVFPNGLAFANGSAIEVAGDTAAPANIAGTVFPAPLELPAGSHVYVDAPAGAPAAVLQAGAAFSPDATVHLALADALIPAGTHPVFTGIAELPAELPKIAGHLAAVETAEWVIDNGALAVKVEMTGEVKTLTWRPAAGGEAAWSGTDANWEDPEGRRVPFSPGGAAVFDGAEPNAAGTVAVAEGQTSGAVSFSGGRDYTLAGAKLGGAGAFSKDGTGTLTIDGGGLDAQPVTVSGGVLRLGANAAADALGHPAAPVTVEAGGTVDVNYTSEDRHDFARNELTHRKIFKIAGEGADGRGALVNDGPGWAYRTFSRIELDGDAAVGGTSRFDTRTLDGSAALQKRPLITGPGRTFTVKNTAAFGAVGTDIDVDKIVVSGGGVFRPETDTSIAAPGGIELADGTLQTYSLSIPIDAPIFSRGAGMTNKLESAEGETHYGSNVAVEAGNTLEVAGRSRFKKTISGGGTVRFVSGVSYCEKGLDIPKAEFSGSGRDLYFGSHETTEPFPLPGETTITDGGLELCLSFKGSHSFSNAVIRGAGYFWPAYAKNAAYTSRFENCAIDVPHLYLSTYYSGGSAVFGAGTRVKASKFYTANNQNNAQGASVVLEPGSEVEVTDNLTIGNKYTQNKQDFIIDGGTLLQSSGNYIYIGWYGKNSYLYLNDGRLTAPGLDLCDDSNPGNFYDVRENFIMNGGEFNLGPKGFRTPRGASYTPMIYLNGGVLNSADDWETSRYLNISFGGFRNAPDGNFTLNTSNHTVSLSGALQGGAAVTVAGRGNFRNDADGPQGIVTGPWRVENSGVNTLMGAAAFTNGLALAENVSAAVKIHAPTSYVSMAAYAPGNEDTAKGFHDNPSLTGYPWLSGRMHDDLAKTKVPKNNVFAYKGEFWVEPGAAGVWTFACSYDDEMKLSIDGAPVCSNTFWNAVSEPGTVDLAAGWHAFKLSALNTGNDAGLVADTGWGEAGLAIGYHPGATASTAASDYTRFDTDTLQMRPPTSCTVLHRRISHDVKADGWEDRTDYDKIEILDSLVGIHSPDWPDGSWAINEFTGYFLIEEEGEWTVWARYDDNILMDIDGVNILKTESCEKKQVTAHLDKGWHSFRVRVRDIGGVWGREEEGKTSLFLRAPSVSGWPETTYFKESNFRTTAFLPGSYGVIGGRLELAAGSVLTNAAGSAASVTGTLSGTGTLEGLFRLDGGVYALTGGAREKKIEGVAFGAGAFPDALLDAGKIRVAFDGRPVRTRYEAGPAMGLEKLTPAGLAARLEVTAETGEGKETVTGDFVPEVENGILFLRNLHAGGLLLIFR